ncbi:DUF4350 domain-containing protein [Gilvibacter sediminis]|uniref:DUF4350 domain-containing protein n=1 Tax=Gilvibacter sediminis TaxID=379071 RepID=UPI002350BCC1|nr:DUF4350 domain-containing protein [Gilvibacter sediminis]MDC7998978.1 DUF4350 domain-containing protein [Gilvibacter sediminis]
MDKRSKRILIAFGVALIVLMVVEIMRPKPLDWSPNYTTTAKTPLGGHIAYEELGDFFDAPVKRVTEDPFEFLQREDYGTGELYFFVNAYLRLDGNQVDRLLKFAEAGNTVFLSSNAFGEVLLDTLKLDISREYSFREAEARPQLYNPGLALDEPPLFQKTIIPVHFSEIDTLQTTVLGAMDVLNKNLVTEEREEDLLNYVRVPVGEGSIYLHTLPQAFSNYYMLDGASNYTAAVLSYLEPSKIYWDEHLKSGRVFIGSPLRYVLNQKGLRWAYYLVIGGLLLFVLVRAKREQRMIPLVEPLRNDSKDFTATIGNLHFQYKNFSNIIAKRITYFLERIRSDYYLNTENLNEDFIVRLASKSGNPKEETQELIQLINALKGKSIHSESDLIRLNKALEKFYK